MDRHQKAIVMPRYTESGFVAKHEMHKTHDDRNKIRAGEHFGKQERYLAPGAGHRTESVEGNKRSPMDNKIRGLSPMQHVTGGCPEKLPHGKMRNESDSGLR